MIAPNLGPFFEALLATLLVIVCGSLFLGAGWIKVARSAPVGAPNYSSLGILAFAMLVNPMAVLIVCRLGHDAPNFDSSEWIYPFLVCPTTALVSVVVTFSREDYLLAVGSAVILAIDCLQIAAFFVVK